MHEFKALSTKILIKIGELLMMLGLNARAYPWLMVNVKNIIAKRKNENVISFNLQISLSNLLFIDDIFARVLFFV